MALRPRYLSIVAAILTAIALGSCGSGDKNVSQSPTSPSPPSSAATLSRVALVVPASVAPGESVQFTANAIKTDGSVENVTGASVWNSSNTRVLQIGADGVANGVAAGEAFVSARYQNRSASSNIYVLPAGTYRLNGRVTDSGFGVAGAIVTVVGGVGEGLTAVTNADGGYALYGLGGHVRLQTKAAGYLNRIEETDVTEHRAFNIEMVAERQRVDLKGRYLLTISAPSCTPPLPTAVLPRSYMAEATQNGSRLTVTLLDGNFIVTRGRGNHFDGFVDATDLVTFTIGDVGYYYYYGQFDLVERYTDVTALIVDGIARVRPSSSGLAGNLAGSIRLATGIVPPFTRFQATCFRSDINFEMARR